MEETIIWKAIDDECQYWVSNRGMIKVYKFKNFKQGRILNPKGIKANGKHRYRTTTINGIRIKICTLVAKAFIPNPENKPLVNHKDGIKSNDFEDNLEWATYSENNKHAWEMGLNKGGTGLKGEDKKGIMNPNCKLTTRKVFNIRRFLNEGTSTRKVANKYGLTVQMINNIKTRRSWKHI